MSSFYGQICFFLAFPYLQIGFVLFWLAKAACKILGKLTTGWKCTFLYSLNFYHFFRISSLLLPHFLNFYNTLSYFWKNSSHFVKCCRNSVIICEFLQQLSFSTLLHVILTFSTLLSLSQVLQKILYFLNF